MRSFRSSLPCNKQDETLYLVGADLVRASNASNNPRWGRWGRGDATERNNQFSFFDTFERASFSCDPHSTLLTPLKSLHPS